MRNLIKKILKEEFDNEKEVMSDKYNICDVMTVNSWGEIDRLLSKMKYDDKYKKQIDLIKKETDRDIEFIGGDADVYNSYLRQVQNIVCK